MDADVTGSFTVIDFVIFVAMLLISAAIGIYFAFFAKEKQNTTKEYLMGGKTIGVFPIAMSLIASNISGIAIMGIPSETYTFGTQLSMAILSEMTAFTFGAYTFLPVIYNLGLMSSYEYLELRFNSSLRKLGSLFFLIGNIMYVPIVIYVPALAFAQTTGINLQILIPVICIVCTFYTTLGGLKAVVWTDTFQTMMMIFGVVAVAIIGTYNVGSVSEVWTKADRSDRIEFLNMSWDVSIRHTAWSVFVGKFFGNLSIASVNQSMVQRYVAMPTLKKARAAIFILVGGISALIAFCYYTGLVIVATFWECDPVTLGYVRKPDGILPYYIMRYMRHIPAIPGIFMAGVFSAALSSMSTCLNSMCGVMFEDFIKPSLKTPMTEARASFIMKIMVVVLGLITMTLASVVDKLGGVIQTTSSLSGITLGTLLGIYILGMMVPWANSKGALVGGIVGSVVVGWISVGAQLAISRKQIVYPWKPFSVDGCENDTLTSYMMQNVTNQSIDLFAEEPFPLFKLSYVLYTPLGVLITLIVGILVSLATGLQDPSQLNPDLLFPFMRRHFKFHKVKEKEQRHPLGLQETKELLKS